MEVQVVFFESGVAGGSVNRLLHLLRGWDHDAIPCGVFTCYDIDRAALLLKVTGPRFARSLCWPRTVPAAIFDRVGVLFVPTWYAARYFLAALRVLTANPAAFVYLNNTPRLHVPALLAALLLRRTVICHLRDTIEFTRTVQLLLPTIETFIVLSSSARDHYVRCGIPVERLRVVSDSIDLAEFVASSTARAPVAGDEWAPAAVTVGTLSARKGQDVALRALEQVVRRQPGARLLLVGEGPERAHLEEMADRMGLRPNVSFLGRVDHVPAILARCDIGILASRREGMPNSVMEYMAAGLPVLVTDLPGIRELVEDGQSGIVVPIESHEELARAWLLLLADEGLRRRMGRRGVEIIGSERFRPQTEASNIRRVLAEIERR